MKTVFIFTLLFFYKSYGQTQFELNATATARTPLWSNTFGKDLCLEAENLLTKKVNSDICPNKDQDTFPFFTPTRVSRFNYTETSKIEDRDFVETCTASAYFICEHMWQFDAQCTLTPF